MKTFVAAVLAASLLTAGVANADPHHHHCWWRHHHRVCR
jgi:hypothetical protein